MLRLGSGGLQKVNVDIAAGNKKQDGVQTSAGVLSFASIQKPIDQDSILRPSAKAFATGKARGPPPQQDAPVRSLHQLGEAPETPFPGQANKTAAKSGPPKRGAVKSGPPSKPPQALVAVAQEPVDEDEDPWAKQFEAKWAATVDGAGPKDEKEEPAEAEDDSPAAKRQRTSPISSKAQGALKSLAPASKAAPGAKASPPAAAEGEQTAPLAHGPQSEALGKVLKEKPQWASRCTVEPSRPGQPQRITISMADASLDDAAVKSWCDWLDRRLEAERPRVSGPANRNRFRASTVDFSENQLGAAGVKELLGTLEKQGVRCEVLRLTGNQIGNEGVRCVTKYLTCSSTAMALELYLSRNGRMTGEGVKWLLGSLAMHPAYPIYSSDSHRYVPLWVRADNAKFKGDAAYQVLQKGCGPASCSVCLGESSADVKCGPRQCVNVGCCDEMKHNCVAHLCTVEAPEGALPLSTPTAHARPIFAPAGKGAPRAPPSGVDAPKREEPRVLYEDDDLAVVLKPAGWSCLPQPKGVNPAWAMLKALQRRRQVGELMAQTLAPPLQAWLLLQFGSDPNCDASRDQQSDRGIAHRLDVDASGLLLVGKTLKGFEHARKQIMAGLLKDYLCLVHDSFPTERGECVAPIDTSTYAETKRVRIDPQGQPATTVWEAIAEYENPETKERYTLVHCRMVTLRTHQLRAHMQHMGHPLVGDPLYSDGEMPAFCPRLFLHKMRIGFFNMQGQACFESASLQTCPDLWRALCGLRKVGGMAMMGCGAPGV